MVKTTPKFGALVVASVAGVVCLKYLTGGALRLIGESVSGSLLVADSVGITVVCSLLLAVVTAVFVDGATWARLTAFVVFPLVTGVNYQALFAVDPVVAVETLAMVLCLLYLTVRNPIERVESTKVDDSSSGTRVGSTLR